MNIPITKLSAPVSQKLLGVAIGKNNMVKICESLSDFMSHDGTYIYPASR